MHGYAQMQTTKAEMDKNNKYLPLLLIWLAQMCYLEKERLRRRLKNIVNKEVPFVF
jgi:hypothetical protein